MTTELEQEFFKVFGIEKNNNNCPMLDKNNCIFVPSECNYYQYPEITDRKLLEMICIANKANIEVIGETVEETKNKLLEEMVYWKDDVLYKEIQQLFKEE